MGQLDGSLLGEVGAALASLHSSSCRPAVRWTRAEELGRLRKAARGMKRALPELAPRIDRVMKRLAELDELLPVADERPIHGHLSGNQILLDGRRVGIVGWDALCAGDPLYDVGRLLAHLIYLGCHEKLDLVGASDCSQRLLAGYRDAAHTPLSFDRLRWQVATALLLRGKISALRPLPPGWQETLDRIVSEADDIPEDSSCFLRQESSAAGCRFGEARP